MLLVRRSRDRFPVVSLGNFSVVPPDRTMCPEVDSASESEYQGFLLRERRPVRLADDLPPLYCRNVKKIRGLNLPGTPWATSACRGRPLLYFTLHSITLPIISGPPAPPSSNPAVINNVDMKHTTNYDLSTERNTSGTILVLLSCGFFKLETDNMCI